MGRPFCIAMAYLQGNFPGQDLHYKEYGDRDDQATGHGKTIFRFEFPRYVKYNFFHGVCFPQSWEYRRGDRIIIVKGNIWRLNGLERWF